jgi:hypothetical protein
MANAVVAPVSSALLDAVDIDYAAMDCVEANVAVQLWSRGARDVHRVLGSQWYFAFDEASGVGGLVLDRLALVDQIPLLAGVALRIVGLGADPMANVRELVAAHGPVLFYGDAHAMPWLPLYGNEHLEHTFLVVAAAPGAGTVSIVDTYTNRTPHGNCAPVATDVQADVASRAVAALGTERAHEALVLEGEPRPPDLAARTLLADNVAGLLAELRESDSIRRFADHHERSAGAEAAGDFALACWLVARKRALHHRWLMEAEKLEPTLLPPGFLEAFDARVVRGWTRAAEFAYLGARRARAGRGRPGTVYSLVREKLHLAELELATELERLTPEESS